MRTSLNKLLSAASVVALCALLPGQAEARFGKSGGGSSSSSSSHSSSGGSHSHSSSPVGASSGGSYSGGYYSGGSRGTYYPGVFARSYYHPSYYSCWSDPYCTPYGAWGFGYRPLWGYPRPVYYAPTYGAYTQYQQPEAPEQPLIATVGADAHGYVQGGGGLGVNLALERDRLGVEAKFNGIFVPADDGTNTVDSIKLFDMHVTYALLAGDHGRLRVGAGVDSAFAPSIVMVGPGLMANAAVGLAGPVGLDASITVVPFPFIKLDWQAGVALGFGPVGLRAGWRRIYLNDNGAVDGIIHEDVFSGPYVGLGLAL